MNWTSTPPTTPGFYAWRYVGSADIHVAHILSHFHFTDPWIETTTERMPLRTFLTRDVEWARLVAADEVKKAWIESYDDVIGMKGTALPTDLWLKSRAKRVMDGNADNPVTQLDPQSPYEGQV